MIYPLTIEQFPTIFIAKGINVSCRTIEGKAYVLLEDKNEFLRLNETGTFIWDKINGTRTGLEIINQVVETYEGDYQEIKAITYEFIIHLHQWGAIFFSEKPFQGMMCSV